MTVYTIFRMHEHLLRAYGLTASQSVYIHDVAANVAAARKVGLHTIEFRGAADYRVQLEWLLSG